MSLRNITLLCSILVGLTSYGQSIERSAVSTAGSTINNSSLTLEYTIGEYYAGELTNSALELTTGYNQGYEADNSSVPNVTVLDNVTVFPNPTNGKLNIKAPVTCEVRVLTIQGEVVHESISVTENVITSIDVSNFASGLYTLEISSGSAIGYSKWIKN
jgi:hypothetical protein